MEEEKKDLETYETVPYDEMESEKPNAVQYEIKKKRGLLERIGDKIKERFAEKEEEKKLQKEVYTQARREAMKEVIPALKEKIKRDEIEKLSKPKRNVLQKIGDEFKSVGGGINTDEKLKSMLGSRSGGTGRNISEKIYGNAQSSMIGGRTKSNEEILSMMQVKSKPVMTDKVNVKDKKIKSDMEISNIDVEAKLKKALGK